MVFEPLVCLAHDLIRICARLENQNGLNPILADLRRVANSFDLIQPLLDVLWKDLQPFRSDNHLLFPATDDEMPVLIERADIAGMKPAVLENGRGLAWTFEVTLRHIFAAH